MISASNARNQTKFYLLIRRIIDLICACIICQWSLLYYFSTVFVTVRTVFLLHEIRQRKRNKILIMTNKKHLAFMNNRGVLFLFHCMLLLQFLRYTYSARKNFKDSSIYSIFISIKKFLIQPSFRMFSAYFGKLMRKTKC